MRSLGGDPESGDRSFGKAPETPLPLTKSRKLSHQDERDAPNWVERKSRDPMILEEGGRKIYLEPYVIFLCPCVAAPILDSSFLFPFPFLPLVSHTLESNTCDDNKTCRRAWQSWLGNIVDDDTNHDETVKGPFLTRNHPNAFQRMFRSNDEISASERYPSREDALTLWDTFSQRVHPILRISFSWELKRLQLSSTDADDRRRMSDAEHAFIFSLFFISVASLSEEECKMKLKQPRSFLLNEYQLLCEETLSRTNLFCMTDIMVLKALTVYMVAPPLFHTPSFHGLRRLQMAGIDRLSTQSLWSLMGLLIRNTEKLGIHRDGSLLGLSPAETEERRRLWWQLQHLDLALAIRAGLTSQNLSADWDAKVPLNIEDEDINGGMTVFPEERKGLTSMSYCLFTYWVIEQQRNYFDPDKGRFQLSWQSNTSLRQSSKDSLISQLEDGLNKKFLQYCDPIKPIDVLLQLLARAVLCGMRQRTLHPFVYGERSRDAKEEQRAAFFDASMHSVEYHVAMHSHPSLKCFQWLTQSFLPWQACK